MQATLPTLTPTQPRRSERAAVSLRELDTPYVDRDAQSSVATPSCCCCCCCCLTALIVGPVYLGVNTASTASDNGRNGTVAGILAGFALPASGFVVALLTQDVANGWIGAAIWFFVAAGLVTAVRLFAGDTALPAFLWGGIAAATWAATLVANLLLDTLLLIGTVGIGILVEIVLIPLWIVLIVRHARRRRENATVGQWGQYQVDPPWPAQPGAPTQQAPSPFEIPPPPADPNQQPPYDPYGR